MYDLKGWIGKKVRKNLAVFRIRTFAWYWRKGRFKQIYELYNHKGFDAVGIEEAYCYLISFTNETVVEFNKTFKQE